VDAPRTAMISDRTILAAAAFVAWWAGVIGTIAWFASENGEPQRRSGAVAFACAFVAVSLVSIIGLLWQRPWLLAASGLALMGMTVITFSPVAFPILLFPAAFLAGRGFASTDAWPGMAVVSAVLAGLLLFASLGALIFHDDAAEWTAPNGTHYGSSDIITRTEVAISLSFSAAAVAVAWFSVPRHGLRA
jgi:hypothetical protein